MQSFWPIAGSKMAALFPDPPVPFGNQILGLAIRNMGCLGEQVTWRSRALYWVVLGGERLAPPNTWLLSSHLTLRLHSFHYTFVSENNGVAKTDIWTFETSKEETNLHLEPVSVKKNPISNRFYLSQYILVLTFKQKPFFTQQPFYSVSQLKRKCSLIVEF